MFDNDLGEFSYEGRETLADLTQARNYNSHLAGLIQKQFQVGDRVLDFGAGNGHFLRLISAKSANFFALEPDPELAETIRTAGIAETTSFPAIKPESFDFIYSLNVLEHINFDEQTLRSLWSWIRPGGILIYVPAFPHLYSKFDARIGHYRRYTKRELSEKALAAGFEVEKVSFMDPIGFFVAWAYRLFLNNGEVSSGQLVFFDRFLYPISRLVTPLTEHLFGKNLILIARRAASEPKLSS